MLTFDDPGSIMNHSDTQPNVSYTLDKATLTIRFSTSRPIHPGDELCIYYGQKLWFSPAEKQGEQASDNPPSPEAVLPFGVGPDLLVRPAMFLRMFSLNARCVRIGITGFRGSHVTL